MTRSTTALRALVAVAALAAPLGLAMPAQAYDGCTVDPQTPYHNGDFTAAGVKVLNYEVDITCEAGLVVTIYQERWEDDPNQTDDLVGRSTITSDFTGGAATRTRTTVHTLPDTDDFTDNYEEMYQAVRFTVTNGPVTSALGAWDYSYVRSIRV